ncbi:retrotransposon protein [Cucumis melo var. makuwa]|uniref:Retrotransposon protein n=1 Tax=Cucumis melo var. makuwa TaxID=1194695 RepID=A0A5A7UGA9_CUCMM|nr:retrotransposon protein [Cucumis melo var. makuwa]TYK22456.1 retrotransposon protein [Cucumis melo var. makuwa]
MTYCDDVDYVNEGDSTYTTTIASEDIHYIEYATSNRALRHVWTKEKEGTLVECLMELVSIGGWKSDNGTFRLGYLAQLVRMMAEKLPGCQLHPAAKGFLNKLFSYYNELTYVFGRDKATGQFAETFADVGLTSLAGRPSRASEGRTGLSGSKRKRGSQREVDVEAIDLTLDQTNKQLRMIVE